MADTPQPEKTIIETLGEPREREIQALLKSSEQAKDRQEWEEVVKFLEIVLSKLDPWDKKRRKEIETKIKDVAELQNVA